MSGDKLDPLIEHSETLEKMGAERPGVLVMSNSQYGHSLRRLARRKTMSLEDFGVWSSNSAQASLSDAVRHIQSC